MQEIGLPCVVRPSFTLGGTGSSIAYNRSTFDDLVQHGLDLSPIHQVLLEESVIGWKEFEMEVMRDKDDNCVIICSIENFDPMGVHTGDSITVAPAQTLTDKEYQRMRDASIAVMREIGVETGGSNIQFAIDPKTGRMVVIEMNPRVSRSSALASKATGFPIAKIAAKLAVGYRLHELPNDITRETMACFEPTIDYVVTKVPRFAFEKFPEADPELTTQMKSVGETMAIGRTFKESFQKALRGLEVGSFGFGCDGKDLWGTPEQPSIEEVRSKLVTPGDQRVWCLRYAIKYGMPLEEIYELTGIDPWFLENLHEIVEMEEHLRTHRRPAASATTPRCAAPSSSAFPTGSWPRSGTPPRWTSARTASAAGSWPRSSRSTPAPPSSRPTRPTTIRPTRTRTKRRRRSPGERRVMILGGGPNRIGQGIEFDYCCCHASFALRELGIESIMVNSNPETVSTDYDTSDLLFFEPLTTEDVLNICDRVEPDGVIVQFGGQTPLNLARALSNAGVPIIGTSVDTIEDAEDREKFENILHRLGLKQPASGIARNMSQARTRSGQRSAFPCWCGRVSCSAAGRWKSATTLSQFERFVAAAFIVAQGQPVLIDRFLEDAIEVDVDAIADGQQVIVAGIMEHIEEAGVHSGDSACAIPPYSLPAAVVDEIRQATVALARRLQVRGLMNIQYAVKREEGRPNVYVLEVNPRASRTVPFVSKATGMPLAKAAAKVMVGVSLAEQGYTEAPVPQQFSVKEAVFPFVKFAGVDIVLGPEMKSTGEVMGISEHFPIAFAKSQLAAGTVLPQSGKVFISVTNRSQGARGAIGPAAGADGLRAAGHPGHGPAVGGGGHPRPIAEEAPGGAPQRARLHDRRQPAPGHQHAQRQGRPDRRGPHPRRGRLARRPLHHHAPSRRGGRRRDGSPAQRGNDGPGRARPLSQPRPS